MSRIKRGVNQQSGVRRSATPFPSQSRVDVYFFFHEVGLHGQVLIVFLLCFFLIRGETEENVMSRHTADHLLNIFQTVNGTANTSSLAKHLARGHVKLFKEFGPQLSYREK